MRSAAGVAWFAGPAVTIAYLAGAALATSHRRRSQREPLVDAGTDGKPVGAAGEAAAVRQLQARD